MPGIAVARHCTPEELKGYFDRRSREYENQFKVEQLPDRRIRLTFPGTKWLFNLKVTLRVYDGQWSGAGDLDLNPTRFLALASATRDPSISPEVNSIDLMKHIGSSVVRFTLDGKDNCIPDVAVPMAVQTDWPQLLQSYASAVLATLSEIAGTLHDYDLEDRRHEPLLRLTPLHDWTLKQAEIYVEMHEPQAPLKVAAIADHGRSLANLFTVENHGRAATFGEMRIANMPAMFVNLGAEGVNLSVYAKAFDRVRVEVRYNRYPLKSCRLTRGHFSKSPDFIADIIRGVRADGVRRISKFLAGYEASRGKSSPHLLALVGLLGTITRVCKGDPGRTNRLLTLLILNNGLSRTGHQEFQDAIDVLLQSGILRQARATLRARRIDYVVSPYYGSAMQALRSLSPS